jgi:hypothetical protein
VTQPTIGRLVHYRLSSADADSINVRRSDYRAFAASHAHPHEPGQPGATGHVAHIGNSVAEGEVYPAMVVRTFDGYDGVNLQVHLDGNDLFWATSRKEGDEPGQWRWPTYDPKAALEKVGGEQA